MRNFLLGLLIGFTTTMLWTHFTSADVAIPDSSLVEQSFPHNFANIEFPADDVPIAMENSDLKQAIEKHLIEKNEPIDSFEIETKELSEVTSAVPTNELRQRFNDLVANIDDDKLSQANSMLDLLLQISPDKAFKSEKRDNAVAVVRENELENKFYEKKLYKGLSEIKTIECRSSLCKVEITLPDDVGYSPFPLIEWDSSLKTSHFHPGLSGDEPNTMVAYFGIEGTTETEFGFDLKDNSSN